MGAGGKVSGKECSNSFTAHFSFESPYFEFRNAAFSPHKVLISLKMPHFAHYWQKQLKVLILKFDKEGPGCAIACKNFFKGLFPSTKSRKSRM